MSRARYTFSLIDDDARNCKGTKLMDLGRVFTDKSGDGYLQRQIDGLSLRGRNSAIGNYLLLTSSVGLDACCRIEPGTSQPLPLPTTDNISAMQDLIVSYEPELTKPFEPEMTRPVPFIMEIKPNGRVKIGWTLRVQELSPTRIQKSKVAMRPNTNITELRKRKKGRHL